MSDVPQPVPESSLQQRLVVPRPVLTTVLVAINVLVFAAMVARTGNVRGFTTSQVLAWGADWGPLTLGSQPWRALTSNYVHGGIVHIVLNMWCLWNLGMLAEPIFGRLAYLLLYTACGLAGSLLSLFWNPLGTSVGASGAVFGLAGALIAALYLGKLPIDRRALQPTLKSLISFAGYNLIFGFVGNAAGVGIDNAAHVGGLLMGLALGAVLGQVLIERPSIRRRHEVLLFLGAALVLIVAGAALHKSRGYIALLNRASDAMEQHRLSDAKRDLEQVIARHPNNNMALVLLGNVLMQQKDYAQAETLLKRAEANDPSNLGVLYNLGLLYASTDRYEDARVIFEKLTRDRPNDDDAWMLLGASLDGLNRRPEAVAAYKKAVTLNPNNPDAWREFGLVQAKLDELDSAIASLRKSLELEPNNPETWRNLGFVYTSAHRPEDAAKAFDKADQLRENQGTPRPQ